MSLIYSIIQGVVVVLFFQCMGALLDPVNRAREGIKWRLVAHTAAMFSFATIYIATTLEIESISFIDNREFPGDDVLPPGPFGYQFLIFSKAISILPQVMFFLNNWLADGLLVSAVTDLASECSMFAVSPPAVSLLCYIFYELLGDHLSMPDVSGFFGYVLEFSQAGSDGLG